MRGHGSPIRRLSAVVSPFVVLVLLSGSGFAIHPDDAHRWSDEELRVLSSLWLDSLPPMPGDPSNKYADDPEAIRLGKRFFFDNRFSGNKKVSCGTCHRPDYAFSDNLPLAHGMGETARRTMPLIGMAYQPWLFWDGRKDSTWSQALGPIESPVEHGFTRTLCFLVIQEFYRTEYEALFGPFPEFRGKRLRKEARPALDDVVALKAWVSMTPEQREGVNRVYANMGKAIGAYVRTINPGPARFDTYVEAALRGDEKGMKETFTVSEALGLKLFIGKAACTNCHTGPLFTNGDFHNVGVPDEGPRDEGRSEGIVKVLADEFNCLSAYSDAGPRECAELRFIDTDLDTYRGAFKTPTLRNVADHPPYMHAGQFGTLREVLEFYRQAALEAHEEEGHQSIEHGDLSDAEIAALEAFLGTLSGPLLEGGRKK
jgi:cytochrome c peroxidase